MLLPRFGHLNRIVTDMLLWLVGVGGGDYRAASVINSTEKKVGKSPESRSSMTCFQDLNINNPETVKVRY